MKRMFVCLVGILCVLVITIIFSIPSEITPVVAEVSQAHESFFDF